MIDWTAQLDETANVYATAKYIGMRPAVLGVITASGGGKLLYGYGEYTSTICFGWVIMMWNNLASVTTDCGLASVVTGYVTMLQNPIATTAALCLTNV
jgi:hypothetical protein